MNKTPLLAAIGAAMLISACKKEEVIVENIIHQDTTIINRTEYNAQFIIADQSPVANLVRPAFLKKGSKVVICAASNSVTESELQAGAQTLQSWGLEVAKSSNLLSSDGRYAGSLQERVEGFQDAIDDPDVRAIFMARGGYGAAQILPFINWKGMEKSPKWLVGYSDVTAIHIAINNLGTATIHGPMIKDFNKDAASANSLKNMLFGTPDNIEIPSNSNCVQGHAKGRLVGGNLSLIYAMSGTAFDLNTMDAILFIEDTGESNYSVDRMLLNLQQSGKLQQIKGVVIGEFINATQGMDLPLNEIIHKYVGKLGVPVVYGIPSGHDLKNLPLMLGSEVSIDVDASKASISFDGMAIAK